MTGLIVQVAYKINNGKNNFFRSIPHNDSFTVSEHAGYPWIRLFIKNGSTFDNETFYPMLRPADLKDDTYVPYAPSNYELYRMILKMQKDIASLNAANDNAQEV